MEISEGVIRLDLHNSSQDTQPYSLTVPSVTAKVWPPVPLDKVFYIFLARFRYAFTKTLMGFLSSITNQNSACLGGGVAQLHTVVQIKAFNP